MTRDEAIRKAKDDWRGGSSELWLVNALANLGVLKLDEPKSAERKLKEYLTADGYGAYAADGFIRGIDSAGLKIVEK